MTLCVTTFSRKCTKRAKGFRVITLLLWTSLRHLKSLEAFTRETTAANNRNNYVGSTTLEMRKSHP